MAVAVLVKVNTSALRNAAAETAGAAEQLQRDFDALQDCVRKTNRYWAGLAGDQYRQNFQAEKAEISSVLEALRKYPADLLSMAGIYEQTEKAAAQDSGILPNNIL